MNVNKVSSCPYTTSCTLPSISLLQKACDLREESTSKLELKGTTVIRQAREGMKNSLNGPAISFFLSSYFRSFVAFMPFFLFLFLFVSRFICLRLRPRYFCLYFCLPLISLSLFHHSFGPRNMLNVVISGVLAWGIEVVSCACWAR